MQPFESKPGTIRRLRSAIQMAKPMASITAAVAHGCFDWKSWLRLLVALIFPVCAEERGRGHGSALSMFSVFISNGARKHAFARVASGTVDYCIAALQST
jgi:hypothetical protein